MFLNDFPGQQKIKNYFSRIVTEKRVPHALLLVGPEGCGKLALAIGLANLLQCDNPVNGLSCKECPHCQKASKFFHPDIHFAFPVIARENAKRENVYSRDFLKEWRDFCTEHPFGDLMDWLQFIDGANKYANINVKECQEIIRQLGLKSFSGKYKVQIIWQAEMLGKESNRLLKLIEEPSEDTVIILVAQYQEHLLNTIISRCQILNIPPLHDADILKYLSEKYNPEEKLAREICYVASGDIHKAATMATGKTETYSQDLLQWLRIAYLADPEDITAFVDQISSRGRQEIKGLFIYSLHFFREYHQGMVGGSVQNLRLTESEKNTVINLQDLLRSEQLEDLQSIMSEAAGLIDRNLYMNLLLMELTLKMGSILKKKKIIL